MLGNVFKSAKSEDGAAIGSQNRDFDKLLLLAEAAQKLQVNAGSGNMEGFEVKRSRKSSSLRQEGAREGDSVGREGEGLKMDMAAEGYSLRNVVNELKAVTIPASSFELPEMKVRNPNARWAA